MSDPTSPQATCLHPVDSIATKLTPNRPIQRHVFSEPCIDIAKRWISDCVSSHSECQRPVVGNPPTRLLHVGNEDLYPDINLCETKNQQGIRWCALSYCWGIDQPVKTTRSTYNERCKRIPLSSLPLTLQDAVTVTRKLGIEYLWIDCLCIIQDDAKDMSSEIAQLPTTFQQAYVTVSASTSSKSTDGFLQDRQLMAPGQHFALQCRDEHGTTGRITITKHYFPSSFPDPANERAWTYQERCLSPRLLDFSSTQLRWRCRTTTNTQGGHLSETGVMFPASHLVDHSLAKEDNWITTWIELVKEYCDRKMTLESDKLVAISALAQEFSIARNDRYLAGLWESTLAPMLLWRTYEQERRPSIWRAPSWSWASIQSDVHFPIPEDKEARIEITVVQAEVTPTMPQQLYSGISSGFLIVTGLLKEAPQFPPPTSYNKRAWPVPKLKLCDDHSRSCSRFAHCHVYYDTETTFDEANNPVPLYCLKVLTNKHNSVGYSEFSIRGIVLAKTLSVHSGPHQAYRRVAYFEYQCDHCQADPFKGTEYQTITLV